MAITNFLWDFDNDTQLSEVDQAGPTTHVYTVEPSQVGMLISQCGDGNTNYFHCDAQNSIRQLTDSGQNITDSYTYSSFGELLTSVGITPVHFLYNGAVGAYYDSSSSIIYMRSRFYNVTISRWMSVKLPNGVGVSYYYLGNSPSTSSIRFGDQSQGAFNPGIFIESHYCFGCGGFGARFDIFTIPYRSQVVQRFTFDDQWYLCRVGPCGECTPYIYCECSDSVYEVVENEPPIDTIYPPKHVPISDYQSLSVGSVKKPCTSKGTAQRSATVRLFSGDLRTSGIWVPAGLQPCGRCYDLDANLEPIRSQPISVTWLLLGPHKNEKPSRWDTHLREASWELTYKWNCCDSGVTPLGPVPDTAGLRLAISDSFGNRQTAVQVTGTPELPESYCDKFVRN